MASLVGLRKEQVDPTAVDPGTPYVGLENIPRRSMWLDSLGTASDVSSNKSRYGAGDILFGKLRPYFHKVVTAPDAGICSTDILVLTAVLQDLEGFALAAASSDEVIRSVTSASEGTRMPRTSWKDLASIEVPWPGAEEAMKLSRKITTLRRSVLNTMNETNTLAATRDALLPQLMSGKLRVRDAEKVLEGAGV